MEQKEKTKTTRQLTSEERREINLSQSFTKDGKPKVLIYYINCPLCNKTSPIKSIKMPNLETDELIQIRKGGGKALGFSIISREKTLRELKNVPQYREIIGNIRDQCEEILRMLK